MNFHEKNLQILLFLIIFLSILLFPRSYLKHVSSWDPVIWRVKGTLGQGQTTEH